MVREALEMDDLYVFDGNNKPDRVDRVTIDYHHVQNQTKQPFLKLLNMRFGIYTGDWCLSREIETLEHIQNIAEAAV